MECVQEGPWGVTKCLKTDLCFWLHNSVNSFKITKSHTLKGEQCDMQVCLNDVIFNVMGLEHVDEYFSPQSALR